jgi:hypothetical protein
MNYISPMGKEIVIIIIHKIGILHFFDVSTSYIKQQFELILLKKEGQKEG